MTQYHTNIFCYLDDMLEPVFQAVNDVSDGGDIKPGSLKPGAGLGGQLTRRVPRLVRERVQGQQGAQPAAAGTIRQRFSFCLGRLK
jgi:hypothetical protein